MRGHMRRRGDSWELGAYVGPDPVSGRQKYVTRTVRGTKREAEDALARLVDEVPAALASPPRIRREELARPDPGEVVRLLEYAARSDPDFACFLHLGATSGARRGEILALRWTDLDLDLGTLTIARAIIESSSGVVLTKDTKTHASRRIALDLDTLDALALHRKRAEERATACGVPLAGDALIFSSKPDGSRPWTPSAVTRRFIRLRDTGGFKGLRLHDLRHFAATRLLVAGVPVRTVSGRLGHSNAATTLGVYAHFVEESDREAVVALGSLLAKERGSEVTR